jgi:ATP-dependent helicase/nuclease subunit B
MFPIGGAAAASAVPQAGAGVSARAGLGWDHWVAQVQQFVAGRDLVPADAVVLLPLAEHLPLARDAWARRVPDGPMPRFETGYTLVQAAAPPAVRGAGEWCGDPVLDRLSAELLVRGQPWGDDWARRDRVGFERVLDALLGCASALARAWAALHPSQRPAWLAEARSVLATAAGGVTGTEALLARVALEWVVQGTPASDALFDWQAQAWIALQAGGPQAGVHTVMEAVRARGGAVAQWQADPPAHDPFAGAAAPVLVACRDFEDEAQRSAERVLAALAAGHRPVALVALDRLLVRRVRALLEGQGLAMADESGWKLSTTRAAAAVMAWLRAARPGASADELLDALKSGWGQWALAREQAAGGIERLERWLRRRRAAGAWAREPEAGPARELWHEIAQRLQPLRGPGPASLGDWLQRLRAVLDAVGAWEALWADAAGAQALVALRLPGGAAAGSPAWQHAGASVRLGAADFVQWVDGVFEQVPFEPPAPDQPADVVITPLSRTMLRPFGAVVVPGCDEAQLGATPAPVPLLGAALAARLGLPGAAQQREAEQAAFALLLAHPRVSLLHRHSDQGRPLGVSPLVQRLRLALQRRGVALPDAADTRTARPVPPAVLPMPRPVLPPAALPVRISATAYQALRDCPYRFASLFAWGLSEAAELDDEPDVRDWGQWLHAVLQQFHATRSREASQEHDLGLLQAAAVHVSEQLGLGDARFLPRRCEFDAVARHYVAWWHDEERRGARVDATEVERELQPPWLDLADAGVPMQVKLKGVLDRIDHVAGSDGRGRVRVLDYKTTDPRTLKQRVADGAEDTQLAFYALLVDEGAQPGAGPAAAGTLQAAYLALRHNGVTAVEHRDVADSARLLRHGLRADLQRMAQGAALPALGEGHVCDTCTARGLCRRDEWK